MTTTYVAIAKIDHLVASDGTFLTNKGHPFFVIEGYMSIDGPRARISCNVATYEQAAEHAIKARTGKDALGFARNNEVFK